jgi:integrase
MLMKRRDQGSIFRHSDGKRWVARLQYIDARGNRKSKWRTAPNHEQAKSALSGFRSDINRELTGRKTYAELDGFYRETYVHPAKFVGGQKVSGFRQKMVAVNHYLDAALQYFGERPLDEISFSDLQNFKASIADKPVERNKKLFPRSVSDVNHHLKKLRRLFNVAVEQDWLEKNPFNRGSNLIQVSLEVERTRILSANEEDRLLSKCIGRREHLRPVVVFAIESALRRGELQTLRWSDIDFNRRHLKIESQNSKTLKSRLVPLSARALDTLAQLGQNSERRRFALVFGGSDFKRSFAKACELAKLGDVHFHDLRHTAITRWLEKGISPAIAMKASGHSQMKTFLRYVNQSADSVYEFALKLDKAA